MKNQIANILTLFNLFFGCLAIVYILQNGIAIMYPVDGISSIGQYVDVQPQVVYASICIGIAALIDFLDGFIARALKSNSTLGIQLDSLSDVVSFGVAPAMILYQFLRLSYADGENGMETSIIWLVPAFFLAMAAAYRLGKFNLKTYSSNNYFLGLPVPAVGILIASFPLIYFFNSGDKLTALLYNKWFLYACIVVLSCLMLSKIKLLKINVLNKSLMPAYIIILLVAVISFIFCKWWAVPITFMAYLVVSFIFKNKLV